MTRRTHTSTWGGPDRKGGLRTPRSEPQTRCPKGASSGGGGPGLGPRTTCLPEVRPHRGQPGRWGRLGGHAGCWGRDRRESCLAPEAQTPRPWALFRAGRGCGPRGAPRAAEARADPGCCTHRRPAPSTVRCPASWTPPALGPACTTRPPPGHPSPFLPRPWPAHHRPGQGRQSLLCTRAYPPSGIHTPPGDPAALSHPIAPEPRPVWPLDHALHFPHELSIMKPLTPKNGISVLSLSSQFGHWPQLPPMLCPEAPRPSLTLV